MSFWIDCSTFIYHYTFKGVSATILSTSWQNCFTSGTLPAGTYLFIVTAGANVTANYADLGDVQFTIDGGSSVYSYTAHSAWVNPPVTFAQVVTLNSSGTVTIKGKRSYISGGTVQSHGNSSSITAFKIA